MPAHPTACPKSIGGCNAILWIKGSENVRSLRGKYPDAAK
jgi:hypothetical protein